MKKKKEKNPTKSAGIKYGVFSGLSALCWIIPLAIFGFQALMTATFAYQKIALSLSVLIVVVLSVVSLVTSVSSRSKIWILLLGLYIALDEIIEPLMVFAACQLIDEWIFSPLKRRYKDRYVINKQIDNRR